MNKHVDMMLSALNEHARRAEEIAQAMASGELSPSVDHDGLPVHLGTKPTNGATPSSTTKNAKQMPPSTLTT
uniref:Ferritin-like domain-containing protein n=1 Tax=Steinernema glaseri TaxID=37863 RepID=A0A1I8AGK2_9BILA